MDRQEITNRALMLAIADLVSMHVKVGYPFDVSQQVEQIEALTREIRQADWPQLLRDQLVQRAKEYEEVNCIPCTTCGQTFEKELLRSTSQITGDDRYNQGFYCPTCAIKIRRAYTSACALCSTEFVGWRVDMRLCPECMKKDRSDEPRRLNAQLSRARQAGLPATLTLGEWLETLEYFEGTCVYCGERPVEAMDHLIPISRGGGTTVDNCVPACERCNSHKADKLMEGFIRERHWEYRDAHVHNRIRYVKDMEEYLTLLEYLAERARRATIKSA